VGFISPGNKNNISLLMGDVSLPPNIPCGGKPVKE